MVTVRRCDKAYSFCRIGIDWLKDLLKQSKENIEKFISQLAKFLVIQKIKFLKNKLKSTLSSS